MKRLLLSLISLSLLGSSIAMHAETSHQQVLSDLQELPFFADITMYKQSSTVSLLVDNCAIEASENSKVIGFIRYFIDFEKQIGKISRFQIDATLRKQQIGFNLFKQAIEDIMKRYPTITQIHWTAVPDKNLDELCTIYQKMVAKLGDGFELEMGPIGSAGRVPCRPMVLKIIKLNNK